METKKYILSVALSVTIFWVCVAAVPIYAKLIFNGSFGVKTFPYPITVAFMQLGFATVCLCILNVIHYAFHRARESDSSWIFGPHFLYKLRLAAPPGLAFGFKYAITNWGILLVDTSTHVLLGATDLIWVVILAIFINKEYPSVIDVFAVMVCLTGSLMIAIHTSSAMTHAFFPILVNLLTPLIGALCVSTLREGAKGIFDKNNRLQGNITKIEFTAFFLGCSALAAFVSAMAIENGSGLLNTPHEPWWTALGDYPAKGTALILASGLLTCVLHVDNTWMASLISATASGVVSEVKVLPQWCLSALFNMHVDASPMSLFGALLGLLGSGIFAFGSHLTHTRGKLILRRSKCKVWMEWKQILLHEGPLKEHAISFQSEVCLQAP